MNCSFCTDSSICSVKGFGSAVIPLTACKRDLSNTTLSFAGIGRKRGRSDSQITEQDLILNRSHHPEASVEEITTLTICPKHRKDLTTDWPGRKSTVCTYPFHTQRRKKAKSSTRRVNMTMSKDLKEILNISLPIGSGKYCCFIFD